MFKVISESYIGGIQGLFKGPKDSKGKFPLVGSLYTNTQATLKTYSLEKDREEDFNRLKREMKEHPKEDLFIDFSSNEVDYFKE